MAYIYKQVKGRPIQKYVALRYEVQDALDRELFKAMVKAEALLLEHRQEGNAYIEIEEGNVDRYLTLVDVSDRPDLIGPLSNLNTALAIEYGRAAGSKTVRMRNKDTSEMEEVEVSWGATEGLFILHRAFGVKGKKKGKEVIK